MTTLKKGSLNRRKSERRHEPTVIYRKDILTGIRLSELASIRMCYIDGLSLYLVPYVRNHLCHDEWGYLSSGFFFGSRSAAVNLEESFCASSSALRCAFIVAFLVR